MKKSLLLLMFGSIILWSCGNSNTTTPEDTAPKQETVQATEDHEDDDEGPIELNNGAKWPVNAEMKPFVENGEKLVKTYIQDGQTDYKKLAQEVKDQNSQLIKSCTMDGKSHEELHKWLNPHLVMVKELEKTENSDEAQKLVTKLNESYQEYHNYFE